MVWDDRSPFYFNQQLKKLIHIEYTYIKQIQRSSEKHLGFF
jgi:hypothetical protein